MLMHIMVLIAFLAILYCLGSGVVFLVKANSDPRRLAKALTWRIALSMALFLMLILAYYLGWITPNQIMVAPPGMTQ